MSPADRPWLQLDQIAVAYGHRSVVQDFSLTLPRGTVGCLLGPSGCGKTTVLRAIAGFEPLAAGEIRLDGTLVASRQQQLPPEQRRIGMVFQDHALFPHLTVGDNVGFGLHGQPDAAQRVAQMLDTVGLGGSAARYPHELSGGQQQRVALARALAPSPRLLLLDEPFSNLDIELRERLGGELRALLKAAGTTALLVTHDQHEAFAIADEIGIMCDGHIQQWASAYTLYHQPANRFVADFVGQGHSCRAPCNAASTSTWSWAFWTAPSRSAAPSMATCATPAAPWMCCCAPMMWCTTTPARSPPRCWPRPFAVPNSSIR